MSAERGSAFLLKIGNGVSPPIYATVVGLRTTQRSVNGEMVAVTSKDSGGWRELLSGAVGDAIEAIPRDLPGWRVASLDYRVRVLAA